MKNINFYTILQRWFFWLLSNSLTQTEILGTISRTTPNMEKWSGSFFILTDVFHRERKDQNYELKIFDRDLAPWLGS